jgi:TM2 domain-containing membrane protein YozV
MENINKEKYNLTIILCLFFGFFGVHRFVNKKFFTGLLMLATLGGFGIWYVIDMIFLLTNNFKNKKGERIGYEGKFLQPINILATVGMITIIIFIISPSDSSSSSYSSYTPPASTTPSTPPASTTPSTPPASTKPSVTTNDEGIVTHMKTPMNTVVNFSYITTSRMDQSTTGEVDVDMSMTSAETTYTGFSTYDEPSEGKEYLKVVLHIKNNSTDDFDLTTFDYPLVVNGTLIDTDTATYGADNPESIISGGESDYLLLYEIPLGATGMEVRYNALGDPLGSFVVE